MSCITQDIIQELKYVKLSRTNVKLSHFPDFMILGPQRTGTTWLYANLQQHPQIFLSAEKEIFFFNLLKNSNHRLYRSNDLVWYLRFFYDSPANYLKKNIKMLMKYKEFYKPTVRGEATASYAAMDYDVIREIVALNPDIRVILMIRNPIARAWSHAKKDLVRNRNRSFSEVSDEEFIDFFSDEYQIRCGRYSEMVEKWSDFVSESRLFIVFFDDIRELPERLLSQVFTFLGVRSDSRYMTLARKRINVTESIEMPGRYRRIIENMFDNELQKLNKTFGLSWNAIGQRQIFNERHNEA